MKKVQSLVELEIFFQKKIPNYCTFKDWEFVCLEQSEIMDIIAFHPPFLKTYKIAVSLQENEGIKNYRSIGIGKITPADTNGHYNNTIFLAMCGWLMASTASIHLAYNFPEYAPQVVEANNVKPLKSLENDGILKPRSDGTTFWVETIIRKKKLGFVLASTNIGFGKVSYGTIQELKFILAGKDSIWGAKEVEEN
jgi:hypothetical protein